MSDERLAEIRAWVDMTDSKPLDVVSSIRYLLSLVDSLNAQHVMDVDQIARLQGTIEGMSEGVEHLKKETEARSEWWAEDRKALTAAVESWKKCWVTTTEELVTTIEGYKAELRDVEQALGKALGFPWYKDDPKTFPDATEADGVCTGIDTPATLAQMAAERIEKMRAALTAIQWFTCPPRRTSIAVCPWCESVSWEGHSSDCQRQAALGIKGE